MDFDGNIVDPFNGKQDIKSKIIRATGDPKIRFSEDPLRMLRAVRFVSKLGFNIEGKTKESIYNNAHSILSVSRERWCEEFNKLLMGSHVEKGLEVLKQTRLLSLMIPEFQPVLMTDPNAFLPSKNLWFHTKKVVSQCSKKLPVLWAGLLHDIAKP